MKTDNWIIRKGESKDFPEMITLIREFAAYFGHPEKMTNQVASMEQEQDFFQSLVVENQDGKLIAYATYYVIYLTWVGKSMYLDDLFVTDQYRRQGIGKALITQIKDIAEENGCHQMRWQVSNWNEPAIGLYKKLGATIDEVERNCNLILHK